MKNYRLKKLNLYDNKIDNAGCKFIALALMWNKYTAIEDLNLKLNRIKDKGGTRFFIPCATNKPRLVKIYKHV